MAKMSICSRTRRVRHRAVAASCISPTPARARLSCLLVQAHSACRETPAWVREHRDLLARGALAKGTRVPVGNRFNGDRQALPSTDLSVMSERKSIVSLNRRSSRYVLARGSSSSSIYATRVRILARARERKRSAH